MSAPLLTVDGINTYYGQSHILQGVHVAVARGTVVGLLGRNGAGKTTTLKSIMGIAPPQGGRIEFDGVDLMRKPPHLVARLGIAYVPEDRGIFPSLSVREHLTLARPRRLDGAAWTMSNIFELFPTLRERLTHRGSQLSGGEQQMLSIARALMQNPRLLILDEPSQGLAPIIIEEIAKVMEQLKANGMTMLLVEQNYPFAARLTDHLYVLGKGRIRWSGTSQALDRDKEIKRTWVGI